MFKLYFILRLNIFILIIFLLFFFVAIEKRCPSLL